MHRRQQELPRMAARLQDRLMFSLTTREQFLVVGILAAAVVGAAVQHWRDARREVPVRIEHGQTFAAPPEPVRPGQSAQP